MLVYCNNFTIFSAKNKYNVSNDSFAFWQVRLDCFGLTNKTFCQKEQNKRGFCCELFIKGV